MKLIPVMRGLIRSKILRKPFYAKLYVTRRCDLRCTMCNVWRFGDKNKEMSLPTIAEVVRVLKKLGVTYLVVTGGEPFIRKDLEQIIRLLSGSGFSIRLQTNGAALVTKRRLKAVLDAGVDDINISLDSLNPRVFDEICNQEGTWSKVMDTIKYVSKIAPHKSIVSVAITISSQNIREAIDLIKYINDLGAYSIPVPVMLVEENSGEFLFRGSSTELSTKNLSGEIVDKFTTELISMKKGGAKILNSYEYLKYFNNALKTGDMKWSCDAGELYFVVFDDGTVAPCDDMAPVAHILDSDFISVFKSKNYKKRIENIQRNCKGCMHVCWRDVSYLFRYQSVFFERIKTYIAHILTT